MGLFTKLGEKLDGLVSGLRGNRALKIMFGLPARGVKVVLGCASRGAKIVFRHPAPSAGSLLGRLKSRLPTTRKGKIIFYAVVVVGGLFGSAGMGIGIWSGYPSFCRSCHHIEPYYQSWASSKHGKENVNCLGCHFKPGALPYIMGKVNGMVEVFKYISGSYGPKLRSEVQDVSCLRSGCHDREKLAKETKPFGKSRFSHKPHFEELRAGVKLRCASCHSQSLHSESDTVPQDMCFTCHLMLPGKDEPAEAVALQKKTADCKGCHEIPKKITTATGLTFDHGKYAASGARCTSCHAHVTQGSGRVSHRQCEFCHNEEIVRKPGPEGALAAHEKHVTEHQVACFECHAEILHGRKVRLALTSKSCDSCHTGRHSVTETLYRGSGGMGVADTPDPMFASGVHCSGCHQAGKADGRALRQAQGALSSSKGAGVASPLPKATKAGECAPCHDKGYQKLATRWKDAFAGYVSRIESARQKAASVATSPEAKKLLAEAAQNIELVRNGRAAHNVRYARLCLGRAEAAVGKALLAAGVKARARVLPTYEEAAAGCLVMCHVGIETVGTLKVAKKSFPHSRHVMSPSVACSQCHNFDKKAHGKTLKAAGSCAACHHKKDRKDCESCHPVQVAVYRGKVKGDARCLPPRKAKSVKCDDCHLDVSKGHSRANLRTLCVECHHDMKHFAQVLDEWQEGVRESVDELHESLARSRKVLAAGELSKAAAARLSEAVGRAARAIELVRTDGSYGAHNLEYLFDIVTEAADDLEEALSGE
ncbi:MAG: multiheme c-type cytochrome [Planctomycetota bacterium]|jgi:nitrate/TMAO reductase-like tetraheme cytochrome c subunit